LVRLQQLSVPPQKLSDPYGKLKLTTTRKANQMNELALERITKQTCLVCGDKLAEFELENSICIMCED
jgi:hypothetical protein